MSCARRDDFVSGASDMFMFAFGAPKVREVEATSAAPASWNSDSPGNRGGPQDLAYGYLSDIAPGPIFIGVEKPMKTYTIDNLLFTHAKVSDDVVYKLIETMEANKADMIAIAPNLREFSAAGLNKKYHFPTTPAPEVLQGQEHRGQGIPVSDARQSSDAAEPFSAASRTTVIATDTLRALLLACVVGWVLDVPRRRVRAGVRHRAAPGRVHGAMRSLFRFIGGNSRQPAASIGAGRSRRSSCRRPRDRPTTLGVDSAGADPVPRPDAGLDRRRQPGVGDALVRLVGGRAFAHHLLLYYRALRAADLRDCAPSARRHRRQRNPGSAGAGSDAPHRPRNARRHHHHP